MNTNKVVESEKVEMLKNAYRWFNARNIDAVLKLLDPDVDWPNGMEGGIEHGHEAVRNYWTCQWKLVDPRVEPVKFENVNDGRIDVTVQQVVKDLSGALMSDQIVHHIYSFKNGVIISMEIVNPS